MRLITYQSEGGPRVAGVRDDGYVDLNRANPEVPNCIKRLLAQGPEGLRGARAALEAGEVMPADAVKLLAPIPSPEKVICVGINYADHAREQGKEPPARPRLFSKAVTALAAPGDDILPDLPAPPSPKRASRKELAAVLRTLPEEQLEVVLMRFVDDMALAEIAEALSIPLGTVKSRLHNALNALREDPRTRSYFLE